MSKVLELSIQADFQKCSTLKELEDVENKYKNGFHNSVDASDFNKMLKYHKMRITML